MIWAAQAAAAIKNVFSSSVSLGDVSLDFHLENWIYTKSFPKWCRFQIFFYFFMYLKKYGLMALNSFFFKANILPLPIDSLKLLFQI